MRYLYDNSYLGDIDDDIVVMILIETISNNHRKKGYLRFGGMPRNVEYVLDCIFRQPDSKKVLIDLKKLNKKYRKLIEIKEGDSIEYRII